MDWLAPIPLAMAVAWAGWRLGLPPVAAIAAGVAALAGGLLVMRIGGKSRTAPSPRFEPATFNPADLDELLLEEKDAILELDDPLVEVQPDSRVVRLFERQDPTPGELVDRIVDFLAEGRPPSVPANSAADNRPIPDASAALHDALANIRASLR